MVNHSGKDFRLAEVEHEIKTVSNRVDCLFRNTTEPTLVLFMPFLHYLNLTLDVPI